jgi:hypothetical protein
MKWINKFEAWKKQVRALDPEAEFEGRGDMIVAYDKDGCIALGNWKRKRNIGSVLTEKGYERVIADTYR